MDFVPIPIEQYARLHLKANPDENAAEFLARLRRCVADAVAGARCQCGELIWAIGSALAGHACFTCITGESTPDKDYEIDEVLRTRYSKPTKRANNLI